MKRFNTSLRGYDKQEVNDFIDSTISEVEMIVGKLSDKDKVITEMKEKLAYYKNLEEILSKALLKAEETSNQIRKLAFQESNLIINEAKTNANRIVNDALVRAEKIELEADTLRRNVIIFKKRLKSIIETQLELVDDIETLEL